MMTGALSHRGPDESGLYLDGEAGLGHARLSIIDLSGGTQPIGSEDGNLWMVCNGEIYNYPELRKELIGRGHRFSTATDVEVILHLYEERGAGLLASLNGQFAFALWDRRRKELFLGRDRLGILPLHYTVHQGNFYFASEVKSLFALEGIPRRIDPVVLDQIFTFWAPLPGRVPFAGVNEVPPGHWLKAADGRITMQPYWEMPLPRESDRLALDEEEAAEEVRELMDDAVRIRLRADVPVGAYLSGGLDSSGVTVLAKQQVESRLRTFGIRFADQAFDEGDFQRRMVAFLGTEHTELRAGEEEIGAAFEEVLWHCERPVLRTAPVPLYLLSRLVRDSGFKVVLTGEGADEVFGGYNIFREAKVRQFWSRRPDSSWRPLLIRRLYPYLFRDQKRLLPFLKSFFGRGLENTGNPFFSHEIRWAGTERIKRFFTAGLREELAGYSPREDLEGSLPEGFAERDLLSRAQYLESALFLGGYLLSSQGDRVAMAHGVEIRPPFLDHRVVEYAARLPARMKIRVLREKHILKQAFKPLLPPSVVARPKQPYRAPVGHWMLNGGGDSGDGPLSDGALRKAGLFDPAKVRQLLRKLAAADRVSEFDGMALTGILSTQVLHRRFVEESPRASVRPAAPRHVVDLREVADTRNARG